MKNRANDLHDILFEQLEWISDKDLKGADLLEELKRADSMCKVAGQIISNGNMVINAVKVREDLLETHNLPGILDTKEIAAPPGKK